MTHVFVFLGECPLGDLPAHRVDACFASDRAATMSRATVLGLNSKARSTNRCLPVISRIGSQRTETPVNRTELSAAGDSTRDEPPSHTQTSRGSGAERWPPGAQGAASARAVAVHLVALKSETGLWFSHDPGVSSLDFAKGGGFSDPREFS